MSFYIHKPNRYIVFLCIIVFAGLNCFYLVDADKVRIDDITIILEALFFIYVYSDFKICEKYRYKWLILIPLLLAVTSAIMAYQSYGQPLFMGIRPQRHWIMALMMYFPVNKLLKSGKITSTQLLDALDYFLILYFLLILLQWILGDSFLFMNVQHSQRFGLTRLYVNASFFLISYFRHLRLLLSRYQSEDLLFVGMALFVQVFVNQSRMAIVAFILTSALLFFFKKTTRVKLIMLGVIVFAGCLFISSNLGIQYVESIVSLILNPQSSTGAIRETGRTFFLRETFKTPLRILFGSGYVNIDWKPSVLLSRYDEAIYPVDNGIFGLFFYYGLSIVVWTLYTHIRLLRDSWKSRKYEWGFYLLCGLV